MAFLVLYGLGQACVVQITNSRHLNLVPRAHMFFGQRQEYNQLF